MKRKQANVSHSKTLAMATLPIPTTPSTVSRVTRTAFSLVIRKTPFPLKLKALLPGLSEEFQPTLADKLDEEEAHCYYRPLVEKKTKEKPPTARSSRTDSCHF